MGEVESTTYELEFNRAVKVEFDRQRLTSNAGVLLLREVDHRLGLTAALAQGMRDPRRPELIRYQLGELLRERIYALALGYSAQDDVDRLAHDPAFRLAVWERSGDSVLDERLASQPTQSRLLGMLATDRANLNALRGGLFAGVQRHLLASGRGQRVTHGTVDLDSFPITVRGRQAGANYNGYYTDTVYHPLVASFSVAGDYDSTRDGKRLGNGFLHAILRQGSVHTASGAKRFIFNVAAQAGQLARTVDFRMDAGFTSGLIMDALTERGLRFVGRLRGNSKLDALAAEHVTRPAGRPPRGGYETLVELGMYQVDTWQHPQRLILIVVDRPDAVTGQLDLFPDHFFLVTNWSAAERSAQQILDHYRPRGTFEDRLGEFNQAIGAHLSSATFAENEATLLLALLAYNLASLARIELEDDAGGGWDLRRFQTSVLKAGARIVKHARRLVVRVAASAQTCWERLARRLARWRVPERLLPGGRAARFGFKPPPRHALLQETLRC